jgi:integrase
MSRRRTVPRCLNWPLLDRLAWEAAIKPGELFDASSAASGWSDATRKKVSIGYSRWLRWLAASDLLEPGVAAGDRVTQDRVAGYIRHSEQSCGSYSVRSYVQDLYDSMRVLAPEQDWKWLSELVKTLRARATPVRDKRPLLRSPVSLIALGTSMMDYASCSSDWSQRRRALHFRDGLLIALLASRPVRARNLASMRIGQHLRELNGRFWMIFSADETKDGKPYEAIVPLTLVPFVKQYLDIYRIILLRGETLPVPADIDALWVSEIGTHLQQGALSQRVRKHTKNHFGVAVTPHLFRDAMANEIAIHNPGYVDDARQLLGHASMATTERHYIQASALVASRRYADVLLGLGKPEPAHSNVHTEDENDPSR